MTRGVAHSPELRAEAVAAVLAGAALADVARRFGISKGTLGNWLAVESVRTVRTEQRARAEELPSLEDLILELIADHIGTIRAQLSAATRPSWLEKQSAAELAALVGTERDTLIRLLAGLRPVAQPPELDAPESSDTT